MENAAEKIYRHPAFLAAFALILAVGIYFRGHSLGTLPAINGDEAFTSVQMREMVKGNPVTLWVPTQRLLSPIYASWVLLTETVSKSFGPTNLATIRLPAVIAGTILLAMVFLMTRAMSGITTAVLATLFLATTPMAIAYSRSAVEQCLMGAVGIVPIYFAFQGRWKSAFAAYAVAILAHPVNVFLAPLIILPLGPALKRALPLFGIAVVVLLWSLPAEYGILNLMSVGRFFLNDPWMTIQSFGVFLVYFLRLYTGTTAYEYFAIPPSPGFTRATDIFFGVGIFLLVLFGGRNLYRQRKALEARFFIGFLISLLIFFIVAGPRALAPGLSRQANYLTVPFALLIAFLLQTFPVFQKKPVYAWFAVFMFAGFSLASFWMGYFEAMKTTGGGFTHRTYISGPVEPKEAIFHWAKSKIPGRLVFLCEDWWVYWPIRYLSLDDRDVEVILLDAKVKASDFGRYFSEGGVAVGFPRGKIEHYLKENASSEDVIFYRPPSYSDTTVLTAWVKSR